MDWTKSGIEHEWEYQLVDPKDLQTVRGWLANVTDGKLTEAYRGDMRSQLILNIDGGDIPLNAAVRVWHVATYGSETLRECLGTFHPDPFGGKYEYGRITGDVSLRSSLARLDSTLGKQVRSVGKSNVIAHFREIVGWALCVPWVTPNWNTSKNFAEAYVWVMAEKSVYDEAQRCADAINGYLGVDELGRVTLTPYKRPKDMGESWGLLPGEITHLGVEVEVPEVVNRVTAKYENNGKTYTSVEDLDASHPWSKESLGRIESFALTSVQVEEGANIQRTLDDAVKKELESKTSATKTYSVDANYSSGVRCGTAGRLVYVDSPEDNGINSKVFCSGREVSLDFKADMRLTLEEI